MTQTAHHGHVDVAAPQPRIAALDGLRGAAVLAVMLFHTESRWLPAGFLGVDVFFVISGFLITDILFRGPGWSGLGAFWLRRARRLAPALMVLLLVVALLRLVNPGPGDSNSAPIIAALTYTTNWYEVVTGGSYFGLYDQPTVLLHTWSLAIEEQFYLAFPLILFVLIAVWRREALKLAAAVGLLAITSAAWAAALWHHGASVDRVYMGTDTRVQGLLVGASLALVLTGRGRSLVLNGRISAGGVGGLVVLCAAMLLARDVSLLFNGGFLLVALATALVILACLKDGPVSRLLSWRPIVALGVISYSVYLWHYPIFAWVQGRDGSTGWVPQVWSFVVTLVVAAASYWIVERPFLTGGFTRWRAGRQLRVYALGATLVVILCLPNSGSLGRDPVPGESWPDSASVPDSILLMGDSVALGLDMYFPRDRYSTQIGGDYQIGCGYSSLAFRTNLGVFDTDACQGWRNKAQEYLAGHDPDAVVVAAPSWDLWPRVVAGVDHLPGSHVFDQEFRSKLAEVIDLAGSQGARLVYIVKYGCLLKPGTQTDFDLVSVSAANSMIDEVVASRSNARVIDPSPLTCQGGRSINSIDGVTLRDDGMHWTPRGGELMWSLILDRIAIDRPPPSPSDPSPATP